MKALMKAQLLTYNVKPLQQTQSQRGSFFKMMTVCDGEKNIIRADLNKSPEGNNCAHI